MSALKSLFASPPVSDETGTRTPLERTGHKQKPTPKRRRVGVTPEEIDTAFYGLMLGVQSPIDCYLNDFEKRSLHELDRLVTSGASHSSLVPRLPSVIPRVMGTLRDPSSSAADLASELGRDAVLVSEVIRLANSPYYRVAQNITSLERAVFVLGRVGVRQLVVNAAFKPLINLGSGHFTKLSGTTLWDQSEKSAVACDCMARQEKADRFSAYLMAIVQNVGFTVALQILERNYDGSQAPHSQSFHERLIKRSRELSWLIAREWEFPANVLEALESQLDSKHVHILGNILYTADKLAKLHILAARGRFKDDIERVTSRLQGRLTGSCRACYAALSD